ncbi:MAG: hypothetical protein ACRDBL_10475 [Rhabdaerophilum sp.]
MDNDKTAMIIIGVLALVFGVAIFERLQTPLPMMGTSSSGGVIAGVIGAVMCLALMAGWVFNRDNERGARFRSIMIWGVIITLVVFGITLFGGKVTSLG